MGSLQLLSLTVGFTISWTLTFAAATTKPSKCECWDIEVKDTLAHVCGTDGKQHQGVVPAYYGNCTSKVKLSPSCKKCNDTYDPVCATDGINYNNPCSARCAGVEIVSYGPCSNQKNADIKCMCPKKVNLTDAVCGADGETYGNECYAKCKGTTVKSVGRCPFPKLASCMCGFDDRKIVCGQQRREFSNLCFAACGKSAPIHYGDCLGVPRMVTNNWMRWASYSVCGANGKEYGNMCQANCKSQWVFVLLIKQNFNKFFCEAAEEPTLLLQK
ncbi:serine protease inhibitor dipetalogastin-like isoform X2 [Paramacrobiotus metropolitanus]|uniref:serine protease inhibitor dipetalogastin-like isoform X2 n=1 Tax=Paramacrobiotus metropolitanus TaxID=2943436 RepID=UPI0024456FBA|nr:serine protease inhibitor dipetalogastin-like isoform X2 [Paramacrobiotus metropolitanus]